LFVSLFLCSAVHAAPQPLNLSQYVGKKVMMISAHPDDIELSCAGTLIVEKMRGKKVGIVDLTQGELGTRGNAETRKQEAQNAAAIMEIDVRENLSMADGFFKNDKEHQLKIITALRKYQPEIVICNAPEDRHPDHGRSATLIEDAVFLSDSKKLLLIPKKTMEAAFYKRNGDLNMFLITSRTGTFTRIL